MISINFSDENQEFFVNNAVQVEVKLLNMGVIEGFKYYGILHNNFFLRNEEEQKRSILRAVFNGAGQSPPNDVAVEEDYEAMKKCARYSSRSSKYLPKSPQELRQEIDDWFLLYQIEPPKKPKSVPLNDYLKELRDGKK